MVTGTELLGELSFPLMMNKIEGGTDMKTNRIMDEIRSTISPEMKLQMELSVASYLSEALNCKRALTTDLAVKIESAVGLPS